MRKAIAVVTSVLMVISLLSAIAVGAAAPIDYRSWLLQQPDGSAITSSQLLAGYSSVYFHTASDGGQAFVDPYSGKPTAGSKHPRTEMREQTKSGSKIPWGWAGTNTMTNQAAVTLQGGGSKGSTTIGQIFNSTDSIPLVELEYEANLNSAHGNFKVLYEERKGGGTYTKLSTKVALGSKFTYALSLSNGVATVSINGAQVFSKTPISSLSGKQFYFKCGDYDQTAKKGPVIKNPPAYTIVELYSVSVVHK